MDKKTHAGGKDLYPVYAAVVIIIVIVLLFAPDIDKIKLPKAKITPAEEIIVTKQGGFDLSSIPGFDGRTPYVEVNNDKPYFTQSELSKAAEGTYLSLGNPDSLGRTGSSMACVGLDTFPPIDYERADLSSVTPTGWKQEQYDQIIDGNNEGGWLYQRCHTIAVSLAGCDLEPKLIFTGTAYLNQTMWSCFEEKVQRFIIDHNGEMTVLYRVTPIYNGLNLLPSGVLMEAESVEDSGDSLSMCIYAYNVQPGIEIDYLTGASIFVGN